MELNNWWLSRFYKWFRNSEPYSNIRKAQFTRIESFISQEIEKAREEVLDELYEKTQLDIKEARQSLITQAIELGEGIKRKDTDPLHSYMPHVYNQAISDYQSKLKELK